MLIREVMSHLKSMGWRSEEGSKTVLTLRGSIDGRQYRVVFTKYGIVMQAFVCIPYPYGRWVDMPTFSAPYKRWTRRWLNRLHDRTKQSPLA